MGSACIPAKPVWNMRRSPHLTDVGESYTEHAGHALHMARLSFKAGFALLVHAFAPDLFTRTGTNTIHTAYWYAKSRRKHSDLQYQGSGPKVWRDCGVQLSPLSPSPDEGRPDEPENVRQALGVRLGATEARSGQHYGL